MANLVEQVGVAGYFNIVKRKAATMEIISETGFFKNLIVNGGMDRLSGYGFGAGPFTYCLVGTGTTAPDVTDVGLASLHPNLRSNTAPMVTTGVAANSGAPEYYSSLTKTWRFEAGRITGNITEVGTGWEVMGTPPNLTYTLYSRALIVDGAGNPITITVLADEILDITYQGRIYIDLTPTPPKTFTVEGEEFSLTMAPLNIASSDPALALQSRGFGIGDQVFAYTGTTLAPITSYNPEGSQLPGVTYLSVTTPYVNGTYQLKFGATFDLTSGNGNIGAIVAPSAARMRHQLVLGGKTFTKTDTKFLKFTYTFSWARRAI